MTQEADELWDKHDMAKRYKCSPGAFMSRFLRDRRLPRGERQIPDPVYYRGQGSRALWDPAEVRAFRGKGGAK